MAPLLVVLALAALRAAPVEVTVDGSTNLVLGDEPSISGALFGITAFEGFPMVVGDGDYRARVAALAPGSFRFPAPLAWYAGPEGSGPEWFETPQAEALMEQTLLFGFRYPITRFLRLSRWLSAEPVVQIGMTDWPGLPCDENGIPLDFRRAAETSAAMVAAIGRADPGLRLVQVWNEPNALWYRSEARFRDAGGATAAHTELLNLTARAIKARCPDVQLLGPVLCWPPTWPPRQEGQRPWYTWEGFSLPFIEGTAETADYFDFHAYNVTDEEVATQLERVAAAGEQVRGRRLRTWITESNYDLPAEDWGAPAEWAKRAIPYHRFLWGLLGQTDKVGGNQAHDLHAAAYALLPTADAPRPVYWVLWIFRDLRGARLVAASEDESVEVAAAQHEDRMAIVCFNGSAETRSVRLTAKVLGGWWTGPEVRALLPRDDGSFAPGALEVKHTREPGRSLCEFDLPAGATVAISVLLDHFAAPARKLVVREAFAEPLMADLSQAGQVVEVRANTPAAVGPDTSPRLRLGLLGPEPGYRVVVGLDAREYVLDAPRPWQEVSLPQVGAGEQRITVRAQGDVPDNLRLAFVSLTWKETAGP